MTKYPQRGAKKRKTEHSFGMKDELFCSESVLLRGASSAVLYGCGRILFFGRERICFSMRERSVSVFGKNLRCTVFSPFGVTIEGEIAGVSYCNTGCEGVCHLTCRKEGEV